MSIEEKIEKYYMERLKGCTDELEKSFDSILGLIFKAKFVINKRYFRPIFAASRDGLEYYLGNTPTKEEKEIIEDLLEKVNESGKDFVVISSQTDFEIANSGFENNIKSISYYDYNDEHLYHSYKVDIFGYRDGVFLDVNYLFSLLNFLVIDYKINNGRCIIEPLPCDSFSVECDIQNANEEIYARVLLTVVFQIVSLLRQKNIYIFDNEEDYDLELITGRYNIVDLKFISAFYDLIPKFLLEPKKFIEIVGEDNFRDFTICSLDKTSNLDINEIINNMVNKRNSTISNVVSLNIGSLALLKKLSDSRTTNDSYEPIIPFNDFLMLYSQVRNNNIEFLKQFIESGKLDFCSRSDGFKYYIKLFVNNPDSFKKNVFGGLFDDSKYGRVDVGWLCYIIETTPKEELQEDLKNGFFDGESDALIYCLNKYANSKYDYPEKFSDENFKLEPYEISFIKDYIADYSPYELKEKLREGFFNRESFAVRYYLRKYIKYGDSFELPASNKGR